MLNLRLVTNFINSIYDSLARLLFNIKQVLIVYFSDISLSIYFFIYFSILYYLLTDQHELAIQSQTIVSQVPNNRLHVIINNELVI